MRSSHEHGQGNKKERQQKGYGDKADRDGTDSEDSGTDKVAVPRYPLPNSPKRQTLECPFAKHDPARYVSCQGLRITSMSYLTQHIARRHVLRDDSPESLTTIAPEKLCVNCTWCRHEFRGQGAWERLHNHTTGCQASNRPATIEQTGVLLPKEFEELTSEVRSVSGTDAKWNVMWIKCFPATPPPGNIVSQLKAQQILQQLLSSSAASPWSSTEIKQSGIEKALGAIFFGLPFTESEPQINDVSTIFSTDQSTFDDLNDGSSTVPESCDDLEDMDQWTHPQDCNL
ncbi:ankyrin 3 [Fusarium agapanthi]|uniref:Ankyrin 3 n=1 Tax=Fusarium agapanthi TaxID=1803897 RepID=A0A9P5E770_9HYPO|nr:ankyrin 3 [Fusarium agapanthi]